MPPRFELIDRNTEISAAAVKGGTCSKGGKFIKSLSRLGVESRRVKKTDVGNSKNNFAIC